MLSSRSFSAAALCGAAREQCIISTARRRSITGDGGSSPPMCRCARRSAWYKGGSGGECLRSSPQASPPLPLPSRPSFPGAQAHRHGIFHGALAAVVRRKTRVEYRDREILARCFQRSSLSRRRPRKKKAKKKIYQVPDPKLKYAQLLAYGKKLDPLPAGAATEANKVRGLRLLRSG